eukprot:scaffold40602_cov98-Phaeocystis_antarctica.AAC.1
MRPQAGRASCSGSRGCRCARQRHCSELTTVTAVRCGSVAQADRAGGCSPDRRSSSPTTTL